MAKGRKHPLMPLEAQLEGLYPQGDQIVYYPGSTNSRTCLFFIRTSALQRNTMELGGDHPVRLGGGHRVVTKLFAGKQEDLTRELAPRETHWRQNVVS